jgi:hypothetical protein
LAVSVDSLESLWDIAGQTPPCSPFAQERLAPLPEAARRYLTHAIAPETPLASAVRLRMHGDIKLKGWCPFEAEQVICPAHGLLWQATVWWHGLPLYGYDRLGNGQGAMLWKLLGLVPVMKAAGSDITRSAAGRLLGECVWLPSALCHPSVTWSQESETQPRACLSCLGETTQLKLELNSQGGLESLRFARWGNPDGGEFGYGDFGGVVEAEETFEGYTVPTRLRIGWHAGTDRFETDGEFFRVVIDTIRYR